jgi:hypothetical protein
VQIGKNLNVEEVLIAMFESNRTLLRAVGPSHIDAFVQQLVDARPRPHHRCGRLAVSTACVCVSWWTQIFEFFACAVCPEPSDDAAQPRPGV